MFFFLVTITKNLITNFNEHIKTQTATPNLTDAQREAIPNLSTLFNKGQDNKGSAVRNPHCCGRVY